MGGADMKEIVYLVVGGEETLCLPRRFEALHLSLASARGLMRVLRPVVETLVLPVLNAWHNLLPRRSIAGKLVGDHDARRPALPLQQLAQQARGGALITPALDQHVEYDAVLVDRAPQPMLYPGDFDDGLIEMPFISGAGCPAPDLVGECLAELACPLPHALVADDDAACGQHLLDHAQAERKAEIQP